MFDPIPVTETKARWQRILDEERAVVIRSEGGEHKIVSPVRFCHSKRGEHENIHVHVDDRGTPFDVEEQRMRTYNIRRPILKEFEPGSRSERASRWLNSKKRKEAAKARKKVQLQELREARVEALEWYSWSPGISSVQVLNYGPLHVWGEGGIYYFALGEGSSTHTEATTLVEAKIEGLAALKASLFEANRLIIQVLGR